MSWGGKMKIHPLGWNLMINNYQPQLNSDTVQCISDVASVKM